MADTVQSPVLPTVAEDAAMVRRAVLACAAGQAFEIFDFVIYGFFAVAIGHAFFPSSDPAASLLASFATFAVGFLFRPVGALVIGYYGDRFGRRKALVVTVGLMACATGITGLIRHMRQSASGHRSCWCSVACCRAFPLAVNGAAPRRSWSSMRRPDAAA